MRHRRATAVAGAISLCAAFAVVTGPAYAGHSTAKAAKTKNTTFAFQGSGYGTRVRGGDVPAGSSTTGYRHIGCTNQAGKVHTNNVASVDLPGLGTVEGVKTRVWTSARHGVMASHSVHKIARVVLLDSPAGTVSLDAVTSQAVASHDAHGFHATTSTKLGGITLTPPVGPKVSLGLPTLGHPITVPGVVTISLGDHSTKHSRLGATADASALKVNVLLTHTQAVIAHSHASLAPGLTGGVFSGHADATRVVTALGDIVKSGPNPLTVMPCQGTQGHVRDKSLASVHLGGLLVVKGANSSVNGRQHGSVATGVTRAKVAKIQVGHGLVVNGVVARAAVTRHGHHVTRSSRGTTIASIVLAGKRLTLPKSGVLTVPGIAKLESNVVKKSHNGISVIGLRITLLDGAAAVVNLAEAKLRIDPLTR